MEFKVYQGDWWEGSSIRNFSAFCCECDMLFRHNSGYEGGDSCPDCGDDLVDANDQQDVWDERDEGYVNGLTEDDEGNYGYD